MRTTVFWILALLSFQAHPSLFAQAPATPDEVVRQLESRASRGGDELGSSIRLLAKLNAWSAVDRWLGKVNEIKDQPELSRTASLIGGDMLLRISLQESLSESGRSAINKLSVAAKAERESPALMRQAIQQLQEGGVTNELRAARTLRAGGNAAIKAIVDHLAQGTAPENRASLLSILVAMGTSGTQGLDQLALYGDEQARLSCLGALENQETENQETLFATLVSAAFASDATAEERAFAVRRITRDYPDIDASQAIAFLSEKLRRAVRLAEQTPNDDAPATIWSLAADRKSVDAARSNEIYLAYRNAYDAARRLSRQGGVPAETLRLALIADLNYRVIVDVDWGDNDQVAAFRAANPVSMESLSNTLAKARRERHLPAALGLIRVIASMLESSPELIRVALQSENGTPSPLVSAVRDSEPRIRFEAAMAINSAAPLNYAGSSDVRKTLAEMARLSDRPTAILIETRPFIALSQESILGRLGFQVQTVQTVHDAEKAITQGSDLALVLSKLRLADMGPTELVDRVRRLPQGYSAGIIFYEDEDASEKVVEFAKLETTSRRWKSDSSPGVSLVPLPGDPAAISDVLRLMESQQRLPSLTLADRRAFRNAGIAAVTK
ncbi:MAG: hypothetical protein AAFU85_20390 [Planctomycetota bacterium]